MPIARPAMLRLSESVRGVVDAFGVTVNETVPGVGPKFSPPGNVISGPELAFQLPHAPGGVPASGVMVAENVPPPAGAVTIVPPPATVTETMRQNAGDSGP